MTRVPPESTQAPADDLIGYVRLTEFIDPVDAALKRAIKLLKSPMGVVLS